MAEIWGFSFIHIGLPYGLIFLKRDNSDKILIMILMLKEILCFQQWKDFKNIDHTLNYNPNTGQWIYNHRIFKKKKKGRKRKGKKEKEGRQGKEEGGEKKAKYKLTPMEKSIYTHKRYIFFKPSKIILCIYFCLFLISSFFLN